MFLYWLVYRHRNQISVVIEPGASVIHARMRAALADLDQGEFPEGHKRQDSWGSLPMLGQADALMSVETMKVICFSLGNSTTNFKSSPGGRISLIVISPLISAISPLKRSPPKKLKPST